MKRGAFTVLSTMFTCGALSAQWLPFDHPLPEARNNAGAAIDYKGRIYVTGGGGVAHEFNDTVFRLDPNTGTGWETLPSSMNRARMAHASVSDALGRIYVFGGQAVPTEDEPADAQGTFPITRTVERYDTDTEQWESLSHMPLPVYHHEAVLLKNGLILILGGTDSTAITPVRAVYQYNPELDPLTNPDIDPTSDPWTRLDDMPRARYVFGAAVAQNGLVYAIGGETAKGVSSNGAVDCFDPVTGDWMPLPGSGIPQDGNNQRAMIGTTAVDLHGRIYVIGGWQGGAGPYTAAVNRFDPPTGLWEKLPDYASPGEIIAANNMSAVVATNGHIFVMGGESGPGGGGRRAQVHVLPQPCSSLPFEDDFSVQFATPDRGVPPGWYLTDPSWAGPFEWSSGDDGGTITNYSHGTDPVAAVSHGLCPVVTVPIAFEVRVKAGTWSLNDKISIRISKNDNLDGHYTLLYPIDNGLSIYRRSTQGGAWTPIGDEDGLTVPKDTSGYHNIRAVRDDWYNWTVTFDDLTFELGEEPADGVGGTSRYTEFETVTVGSDSHGAHVSQVMVWIPEPECPLSLSDLAKKTDNVRASWGQFTLEKLDSGDFLDVAIGNSDDTVTVFTGKGDGTFLQRAQYPAGGAVTVVADFMNDDQFIDLVWTNGWSSSHDGSQYNSISIRYGDGSGEFFGEKVVPVGAQPNAVSTGDMNGDLRTDFVASNNGGSSISVAIADAGGEYVVTEYAIGSNPGAVALGDVDADGDLDIVATNNASSFLSVGINDSLGTFNSWLQIPCAQDGTAVVVGDVNGDPYVDAIAAHDTANTVTVFINPGLAGSEGTPYTYPEGSGPWGVRLKDVNGDGTDDLVVTCLYSDQLYIQLGAGDGRFQSPSAAFCLDVPVVPDQLIHCDTGDVDGDGAIDIVLSKFGHTGSGALWTLLNESPCALVPPDTDPPIVTFEEPQDGVVVNTTSIYVVANIVDDSATTVASTPDGLCGSLPAGGGNLGGYLPLEKEAPEPNVLVVNAVDTYKNLGGNSITVIRDTTPPTIDVISPCEGMVFGSSPITVTVNVIDATATTLRFGENEFHLPSGGGTAQGDVQLAEEANTITITAIDEGENPTSIPLTVILDLTAPIVTIDSPSTGTIFGPGELPVAVQATVDDFTETTVTSNPEGVSGSLPAGGGIVTGIVALVEGPNEISVSATDAADRPGSDSISVILDTTPPIISLLSPTDGDAVSGSIEFEATADDVWPGSGILRVDFQVDGESVASSSGSSFGTIVDTTTMPDGPHTFTAEAFDGKENSASASATVLVDNTLSDISILGPGEGAFVSGIMSVTAQASDAGSGVVSVAILCGGSEIPVAPPSPFDEPRPSVQVQGEKDTTLGPDGSLLVEAIALDDAGNEARAFVSVTIDNTAPEKAIVTPSDGETVSGTIPITVVASDAHLDCIDILVDGVLMGTSSASPFTMYYDTTKRVDGSLKIEAKVRDLAGNESTCSVTVTVDNMAFRFTPMCLNLNGKGNGSAMAHLEGVNLDLLLPTEEHGIHILVPGANAVPAEAGWAGDDTLSDDDADGVPELLLRFDRRLLVNSIKAGIAGGAIQGSKVTLTLKADVDYVLGVVVVRIEGE